MSYTMSQYRYNGNSSVLYSKFALDSNNLIVKYLDWSDADNDSGNFRSKGFYYRDIAISLRGQKFKKNQSYFVSFDLPRDLNFDYNFSLMLFNFYYNQIGSTVQTNMYWSELSDYYQFIRFFKVDRGSGRSSEETRDVHRMVGFKVKSNTDSGLRVGDFYVAKESSNDNLYSATSANHTFSSITSPDASRTYIQDHLYYDKINDSWLMPATTKTTSFSRAGAANNNLLKVNDALLTLADATSEIHEFPTQHFEFVFTPKMEMTDLVLRLIRITEDSDIITDLVSGSGGAYCADPGQPIYGRYVNLSKQIKMSQTGTPVTVQDTFKVYELKNLLKEPLDVAAIYKFGIWGEPWTPMAINGEEIRIGPSGYYELNDFKVTELSVIPREDKLFVIDYQHTPKTNNSTH